MIPKVLPIWQPVGYSTHLIAKNVSEKYGVKTSHTGTLDPMAEGVIIILLGEERLKKYEYAHWNKTYEFEVLFGIATDTLDGMGLVTNTCAASTINTSAILNSFVGPYTQRVPAYSTIKVKGQHLHVHSRSNNKVSMPSRSGEIFELKLLGSTQINPKDIVETINSKISLVTGDFRQTEIINQWQTYKFEESFYQLSKLQVKMTKGLYVRSLVTDIAEKLNTCAFTYSIKRINNGTYSKENAKTLEEIFGLDFLNAYDFVSRFKS